MRFGRDKESGGLVQSHRRGGGVCRPWGIVGGGEGKAQVVMREREVLRAGSRVGRTQDHPRILWGASEAHFTGNATVAQRRQVASVGAHSRHGAELDMEPWPPPGPVTFPCHLAPWPLPLMGFTLLPSNSKQPRRDTNASGHLLSLSHPPSQPVTLAESCCIGVGRRLRLGLQSTIIYSSSGCCLPACLPGFFTLKRASIQGLQTDQPTSCVHSVRSGGHRPPPASLPAATPPPGQRHVSPETPFSTQHPQPSPYSPRNPAEP